MSINLTDKFKIRIENDLTLMNFSKDVMQYTLLKFTVR